MNAKEKNSAITAPKTAHTPANELRGWFALSVQTKESRLNRRQRSSWKRGRK